MGFFEKLHKANLFKKGRSLAMKGSLWEALDLFKELSYISYGQVDIKSAYEADIYKCLILCVTGCRYNEIQSAKESYSLYLSEVKDLIHEYGDAPNWADRTRLMCFLGSAQDFMQKYYMEFKQITEALMREDNKSQVAEQEAAPIIESRYQQRESSDDICFGKYINNRDIPGKCQKCSSRAKCVSFHQNNVVKPEVIPCNHEHIGRVNNGDSTTDWCNDENWKNTDIHRCIICKRDVSPDDAYTWIMAKKCKQCLLKYVA